MPLQRPPRRSQCIVRARDAFLPLGGHRRIVEKELAIGARLGVGGLLDDFDLHCNLLRSLRSRVFAGRFMRQRDECRFEVDFVTRRQVHVAKL